MKDNFDIHKWNLNRYLKYYLNEQQVKKSTESKDVTTQPKKSKN
jgi:hypothetical protein